MRASTLDEVPKPTLNDKINNKENNFEKLVNFRSCRKFALSEAEFRWFLFGKRLCERNWEHGIPNFEYHVFYLIP